MAQTGYPKLLESVRAAVTGVLVDRGVDIDLAREAGHIAAERVRADLGGLQVYVPSGKNWETALMLTERDRKIFDDWKPQCNEVELCKRHNITYRHLRRIIEARREEDRAERQRTMFDQLEGGGDGKAQ